MKTTINTAIKTANSWRIFRVVFLKELRELLRDRKTLFWLLAPPFILPAIALFAAAFIGTQTASYITQGFPVNVINGQAAPGLVAQLKQSPALIVNEDPSTSALITVTIPDNFHEEIAAGRSAKLRLTQRDTSFITTLALGAVRSEIGVYNQQLFNERLKAWDLDQSWLTPIVTDESTASSAPTTSSEDADNNAVVSAEGSPGLSAIFLPLAVTSWLIGGGLGLVVDTTVGEKERQTLESILVTPADRLGIVCGKLSVVFLVSLVVMGLWMIEGLFLSLLGDIGPELLSRQNATMSDIASILGQNGHYLNLLVVLIILLIPFIVLLNSIVMIFCSFAGSYRESNVFLFLLQLILPALVLLSVFSVRPDAGIGWYAAPILGTIVAIRDLFSQTLTSGGLALAAGSAAVYATGALVLASYVYSRDWALARGI